MVRAGFPSHAPRPALQGFDVNLVTTDRVSALHEACLGGHVACAKVLLENGAQVSPGDAGVRTTAAPRISGDVGWAARLAGPGCGQTGASWAEPGGNKRVLCFHG